MNKILLITSIYPRLDKLDNEGTPVCHYFARDWVKLGYEVVVIHTQSVYPSFFYWGAKIFRDLISAKTGAVVYTSRQKSDVHYVKDGVSIYRIPVFKMIPHGIFSKSVIIELKKKICKILETEKFVPNYIMAHFPNPQLELLTYFGDMYRAKTCYIDHGNSWQIKKNYRNYKTLLSQVDIFGFRSKPIKDSFELLYGVCKQSFLCYSGIPSSFITSNEIKFNDKIRNFCFVGSLYSLKRVNDIIKALHKVYPNKDFTLDIVGEGHERKRLENMVKTLSLEKSVKFHGKLDRLEVQSIMNQAECFIMVSAPEAFGLVYLEAMGKGLITIGTKGQGIDGVIVNGINGFLCEAGNVNNIASTICIINELTQKQKKEISLNAIKTAQNLTDLNAAKFYVDAVDNCSKTFETL